jgi:hypothetical protein
MAVLVPAAVLSPTRSPRTSTFANATLGRPIIMRFAYVRAISITAARCLQPPGYDEVRYATRARGWLHGSRANIGLTKLNIATSHSYCTLPRFD